MPSSVARELVVGVDGELVRYGVKASGGLLANLALLALLVDGVGFDAVLAPVVSMVIVLHGGFLVAEHWVFRAGQGPTGRRERYAAYMSTLVGAKLANYALYIGLLIVGVPYLLAWVLGSAGVFVASFFVTREAWHRLA